MTADEFKSARHERKITAGDLAKLLEVDRRTIYNYENGKTPVPTASVEKLLAIEVPTAPAIELSPTTGRYPVPAPGDGRDEGEVYLTVDGFITTRAAVLRLAIGQSAWHNDHLIQVQRSIQTGLKAIFPSSHISRDRDTGRAYIARFNKGVDDPQTRQNMEACDQLNNWMEKHGACLPGDYYLLTECVCGRPAQRGTTCACGQVVERA